LLARAWKDSTLQPSVLSLCLSLATSLAACSDDMDPSSWVNELRLLAVQADSPFVVPGQTVALHALAYDPAGRTLSWGWGTCIDAGSTLVTDCLHKLNFDELSVATSETTHTLVVPATDATYVGVAVVVCPGTIERGTTAGIPVTCVDASGRTLSISEFEVGVKRLYVRDPALNHNPSISGLTWDGSPWPEGEIKTSACKTTKAGACEEFVEHELTVLAPDASEVSVDRDQNPIQESAVVQFYATGGKFEDDVRLFDTASNTWHAQRADAGQLLTFWFVLRDDRGGVSWTSRQVQVP
jgi:hypothetical protein